jgi:hypothetical protein
MTPSVVSFADLLRSAVNDSGVISNAYQQFHNYSLGNQLLAWSQCLERRIQPGRWRPIPVGASSGARCAEARRRSRCACRSQ